MSMSPTATTLLLSNSLARGGAERFTARLIEGMDRRRVRIHLGLLRGPIEYPLPRGVPVHQLGYHGSAHLPRAVLRLRRLLQTVRPHALLSVGSSVNVVAGCALATLRRRPIWIARVDTYRRALWFRQCVLSLLYPMAHTIVAAACGMQRALVRHYPRLENKIISIRNPVNFSEIDRLACLDTAWKSATAAPLLITVGHASVAKRWDILLKAFSRVAATTAAELVLCGDGPLLPQHKRLARQLNLQERVHFLGHCSNPFPLMAAADLFVLSSEAEGMPNALIEAQGLGVCAVATRCNFGPEEIVDDGVTGQLVPVNDAAALAVAMKRLIEDGARRSAMGRAAAELARRRFESEPLCASWQNLIVEAASTF